jgi:hypothetical protein
MTDNTYKIVRFYFNGSPRTIKRGLTLEQAQEHCQRDDTRGPGWFDGYDEDSRMKKCHLDHNTQEALGFDFYRVNNDVNGNPRYVIHFLAFADEYHEAKRIANRLGFRVYRGRDFGGGFVCQSYNLENTAESIINARGVAA